MKGEDLLLETLEGEQAKYEAVKDRLMQRQGLVNPSEPDFADYQLRLVSGVVRDLERVARDLHR
jgi:hypothetical protein